MVFYKRNKSHRKYTKKYPRKYSRRFRLTKPIKSNVHLIKRTVLQTEELTTVAGETLHVLFNAGSSISPFRVQNLPNPTDFSNLYDEYKVKGIGLKFIFSANTAETYVNTPTHQLPSLASIYDKNDLTLPASENEMLEYQSFKVARLDKEIKRYFVPYVRVDTTAYNTKTETMKWTSTAALTENLLGMKFAVIYPSTPIGPSALGVLKIYITYYMAFRTPK